MSTDTTYFAASLPFLDWNEEVPLSVAQFQEDCRRLLSARDFQEVQRALKEDFSDLQTPFLKYYSALEHGLRSEWTRRRAKALGREPDGMLRGEHVVAVDILAALDKAGQAPDPFSAQHVLDQWRWDKIAEGLQGHYFDLEFIVGYALRLNLLCRYQDFASELGPQRWQEYQDTVLASAGPKADL